MVILGAVCGNNGSYTLTGGFTEGTDQSVGYNGHTGVTGSKSATGANEVPGADFFGTVNRQAIIGFVVPCADIGLEGTVSGGAGYTMQCGSGDSGTSSFSLDSSNEAQTLTIAIAPNSAGGD
jgi:hypothetical protein